jgi:hypothetical protein
LKFCEEALAWHRPSLGEDSLTKRQEAFGYRAGHYYLRHPDDEAMKRCMNVSYVFGLSASDRALARMRSYLRRNLLSDWTVDALLALVSRAGNFLPAALRNFICAKIKWYHYTKGFRRALVEAGKWEDSLRARHEALYGEAQLSSNEILHKGGANARRL